jgi:hypothetical protein
MLGFSKDQNPYTAELSAIRVALDCLLKRPHGRDIYIITRAFSVVQAIAHPKQQPGQEEIEAIYQTSNKLLMQRNVVQLIWLSKTVLPHQLLVAKEAARECTKQDAFFKSAPYRTRPTAIRQAIKTINQSCSLPKEIGKFTTNLDNALPGRHVKNIYDSLSKREAKILV